MSMLDSFFAKGFKAAKCKTLLKLTIPRIKLLRNRREIQLRQMRRDIAKLLETGQEATARIRVEHIIREENMMAAQEILELFCELIAVRLPIIETQRECPLDLKEAISSVCFAAPRCADLPEVIQVQMLFASKYGKEFVSAATELRPDCGVNRQLIELLSVRAPSPEKKMKLLKEIAEEHELEWDPEASEAELFKTHEDLLNGPTQFVSASKLPLPGSKHEELSQSNAGQASDEHGESDTDFDLDFPEVPKAALRPQNDASAPEINTPASGLSDSNFSNELSRFPGRADNPLQMHPLEPEQLIHESSTSLEDETPENLTVSEEAGQFLPYITPPSYSPDSLLAKESISPPLSNERNEAIGMHQTKSEVKINEPIGMYQTKSEVKRNEPIGMYQTKSDINVDLQDVLAAAHAAADSAEKAAAAARSAASLAQARISEFTKKKNEEILYDSSENPFHSNISEQSPHIDKPHLEHKVSVDDSSSRVPHQDNKDHRFQEEFAVDSLGNLDLGSGSPNFDDDVANYKPNDTQPQRLNSMDDDSYFSYPNLYTSQSSNVGSSVHSFAENHRSSHD